MAASRAGSRACTKARRNLPSSCGRWGWLGREIFPNPFGSSSFERSREAPVENKGVENCYRQAQPERRIDMASSYTTHITARAADIDILGHVNNAVWVQWMEQVATEHWTHDADPAHVDAYVWVVTRHEIDYRGNVAEGETVTARTWIPDGPRGARFDRLIEFTGPDGKVKVTARSTWAIVDKGTGRILRVPPEVAANFAD
nr:acyl-CoA thioesterase [Sphingobium sp.]